ncbi:MAG: hypothetical protein KKC76_04800, partial [Proteobacteria bacterium]|nr:hypothetical protein [Pseudomonadota bacterium]MBU4294317.1 hypothetical protein [Pseudomonadota bacterium]MCG2746130.1 hypothetical protein [Desulfobulbaceae bacterium]
ASKSSLSSFANVTLYRGAMSSSSLYFEDDYNKYHTKIRMFKFYIVLAHRAGSSPVSVLMQLVGFNAKQILDGTFLGATFM